MGWTIIAQRSSACDSVRAKPLLYRRREVVAFCFGHVSGHPARMRHDPDDENGITGWRVSIQDPAEREHVDLAIQLSCRPEWFCERFICIDTW